MKADASAIALSTEEEADEKTVASEAQWAKEQTWPLWRVVITGADVEYVARPGVNLDDKGVPQPWIAQARAEVTCRARTEQEASSLALRDNSDYFNVESATEVKP